jgi:hypothetical protein
MKTVTVLLGIGGIAFGVLLLKLMYDINLNMVSMNEHIGALSRDVAAMRAGVDGMAQSVASMDQTMQGMGGAISQGSEQFQRLNPMEMMKQAVPGASRPGL